MDTAGRRRGTTKMTRIAAGIPAPGWLVAYDTQTLVEAVDTFRGRCVEAGEVDPAVDGDPNCADFLGFDGATPPDGAGSLDEVRGRRIEEVVRVGNIRVVTAGSGVHAVATFFFARSREIGNDRRRPADHFGVTTCSLVPGRAVTSYLVGASPVGSDPSCPRGVRFVHVRWRITQSRATPLDHIPGQCG